MNTGKLHVLMPFIRKAGGIMKIRAGSEAVTTAGTTITFSSELPSGDYAVFIRCFDAGGNNIDFMLTEKAASGFKITPVIDGTVEYIAIAYLDNGSKSRVGTGSVISAGTVVSFKELFSSAYKVLIRCFDAGGNNVDLLFADQTTTGFKITPVVNTTIEYIAIIGETTKIRTGSEAVTTGGTAVTFSSALPSTDYAVGIVCLDVSGNSIDFELSNKTVNGFTITPAVNGTIGYIAIDYIISYYWASLVTATVENAEPSKIVMTFSQADTSLIASDFTIAGKTITLLERDVTNKVLTLTVSVEVAYGDSLIITFVKTGETANVTNNVLESGTEDLTTFTEVDPESNLAVTTDKLIVTDIHPEHTITYLYYDFGAEYFKRNFEMRFALKVTDIWVDHGLQGVIGVANALGLDVNGPNVEINYDYTDAGSGANYIIGVGGGDHVAHTNQNQFLVGTTYYCKIERIYVGGAADNIFRMTVYTDSNYTIRAVNIYGGQIGEDIAAWGESDFTLAEATEKFRYLMLATSGRADYDDTESGSFEISDVEIISNSD